MRLLASFPALDNVSLWDIAVTYSPPSVYIWPGRRISSIRRLQVANCKSTLPFLANCVTGPHNFATQTHWFHGLSYAERLNVLGIASEQIGNDWTVYHLNPMDSDGRTCTCHPLVEMYRARLTRCAGVITITTHVHRLYIEFYTIQESVQYGSGGVARVCHCLLRVRTGKAIDLLAESLPKVASGLERFPFLETVVLETGAACDSNQIQSLLSALRKAVRAEVQETFSPGRASLFRLCLSLQ